MSLMEAFPASPGFINERVAQLQSPLISYMLPHLPAASIAATRSCCTSFQHLVDNAPVDTIKPALCSVLPALLGQSAGAMAALQNELHRHAASMAGLRSCNIQKMQKVPFESTHPPRQPFEEVLWHPGSSQQVTLMDKMGLLNVDTGSMQQLMHEPPEGISHVDWQVRLPGNYLLCMCGVRTSHLAYLITRPLSCDMAPSEQKHFLLQRTGKDLVSPSGHSILVWPLQRHVFAMLSLPSLEVQFQLPSPTSGSSNTAASASTQESFASEADWSSSGLIFAVLWWLGSGSASHLSVHAAHDGAGLGIIDLHLDLGWQWSPFNLSHLSWCPDIPDKGDILMAWHQDFECATDSSPVGLISRDGSCASLPVHIPSEQLFIRWSPCGRFLHSTQAICVRRNDPEPDTSGVGQGGLVGMFLQSCACAKCWLEGCIWDARTLQRVFTWEPPNTKRKHGLPCYDSIAWSQQGSMCCIGRPRMIICLPTIGTQGAIVSFPWQEVENDDGKCMRCPCSGTEFFFSPCGKVLLAVGPVRQPSSDSSQSAGDMVTNHGVWHGLIDLAAPSCRMHLVGEINADPRKDRQRLPRCIAWHPSPRFCMYALVDVHGDVRLMDRNGNKIVSLLDLELAQPDQLPAAAPASNELAHSETTAPNISNSPAASDEDEDHVHTIDDNGLPCCMVELAVVNATVIIEGDGNDDDAADGRSDNADPCNIEPSTVTLDWCPDGELLLIGQKGVATLLHF